MIRWMESDVAGTLGSSQIFRSLERAHVDRLAAIASAMVWPADSQIFREGEPDDKLYLVVEGLVALEIHVPNRGRVTIQTIGPDEILGWSSFVPEVEMKTASARALQPTSAIAIDAVRLVETCEQDHDLGYHAYRAIAHVIASRLKATRLQLLDMFAVGERE